MENNLCSDCTQVLNIGMSPTQLKSLPQILDNEYKISSFRSLSPKFIYMTTYAMLKAVASPMLKHCKKKTSNI